ncbi:hypothetical protein LTR64_008360 [Lithohypha guttulata]|uniref:uncharacterized protein n=1 Tax=Lithohypha guttulata TaxID=1690604 RepID=UPI002DDE2374|nr:hypothetical protein LTR51_008594 [Lithohypha guttulata]
MSKSEKATYSHGHHASVISTHARRTAANSAGFLLPHIQPHYKILDLGCGPGTITADLAALVPQGSVLGVDSVDGILSQARSLTESRGLSNLTYQTGDANNLTFSDGEFDIVFCHQLLQHVKDPIGVLHEMKRVCKKGGLVAAREADYASFIWQPRTPELDTWGSIYQKVARANGGEPNAGRFMPQWAREAGWAPEQVTVSWNSWCFTGQGATDWALSWKDRSVHSDFAKSAVKLGFSDQAGLERTSAAWKAWADGEIDGCEDKIFVVGNGEILCRC